MVRGESKEYYIAVCNKTGAIAIYNESRNLFLSPAVDGPIKFNTNPDGSQSIMNISRFGRSFSILKIPYAFKLLIQELQVMNVQMRIITEDNVDQLLSMSYSDNINKLLRSDKPVADLIRETTSDVQRKINERDKNLPYLNESPQLPEPASIDTTVPHTPTDSLFDIGDEVTVKNLELRTSFHGVVKSKYFNGKRGENYYEIFYDDNHTENDVPESRIQLYKKFSPPYSQYSPAYDPNSPQYPSSSPAYDQYASEYVPNSPPYAPNSPPMAPGSPPYAQSSSSASNSLISPPMASNSTSSKEIVINPNILDVPEEKKEEKEEEKSTESASTDSGEKKIIIQDSSSSSSDVTTSSGTKKITL
jgi:hypothetical protein